MLAKTTHPIDKHDELGWPSFPQNKLRAAQRKRVGNGIVHHIVVRNTITLLTLTFQIPLHKSQVRSTRRIEMHVFIHNTEDIVQPRLGTERDDDGSLSSVSSVLSVTNSHSSLMYPMMARNVRFIRVIYATKNTAIMRVSRVARSSPINASYELVRKDAPLPNCHRQCRRRLMDPIAMARACSVQ